MELISTITGLAVLSALALYAWIRRPASVLVQRYLLVALLLSGATAGGGALGLAGIGTDPWILGQLATAVALALPLGLAWLVVTEHRRERNWELLRVATAMLTPTVEQNVLLAQVLDLAHAAVRADASSIMLVDTERRRLEVSVVRGAQAEATPRAALGVDDLALAVGWDGRGPVVVADFDLEPELVFWRGGNRFHSFCGVPMVSRGELLGLLSIYRVRPSTFPPEELQVLTVLASQAAVAIHVSSLYTGLRHRYLDTISALASAIEVNDPYTLGHCRRVTTVSRMLAVEMGVDMRTSEQIEVASLLHDIGKIGISGHVLRKLGRLNAAERAEMRSHTVLGAAVLREVEALKDIAPSVLHHHERWDGGGYPHGLRGEVIPLPARVVAVADAYEVMTAGRTYSEARELDAVMAEMARESGRQFDPDVVAALLRLHRRGALRDLLDAESSADLSRHRRPVAS